MTYSEIKHQVESISSQYWKLSYGAQELLIRIIHNIKLDPSPIWELYDIDRTQESAIERLPLFLDKVARPKAVHLITSWEVLHLISLELEDFCPIEKGLGL